MGDEGRVLLIVEDHEPTRRILANLLSRRGWDVRCASTIAEGLAQLESNPACIVLDLMLPDGGGEEILERVRRDQLQARVVVTSATGDEERLVAVREMNPTALIRKPIEMNELLLACRTPAPAPPPP
jgi:DNA-binding response OmpR family regulator